MDRGELVEEGGRGFQTTQPQKSTHPPIRPLGQKSKGKGREERERERGQVAAAANQSG